MLSRLDDLHLCCAVEYITYLKTVKKFLHFSHFGQVLSHKLVVAVVLFLYLLRHQLRVTSNQVPLNPQGSCYA